jgi:hypothetical protein
MSKICPACSETATGRFCSNCGAALGEPLACRECDSVIPVGARFCNSCGAPAVPSLAAREEEPAGAAAGGNTVMPWVITGAAVAILGVVLLYPRFGGDGQYSYGPPVDMAASGVMSSSPSAVELAAMPPREAADRLFNRVMQNHAVGDTLQVQAFLPMAIDAYLRVPELDADGHYHMGVLYMVANNPEAALAHATQILELDTNHLFGLFVTAQASAALGEREQAKRYYQRVLEAFDAEVARQLPEYREHAPVLEPMRQEATQFLNR